VVPGTARALLSSRNGWLPFLPVGLLAVAGALALSVRRRWWMLYGTVVVAAYVAQIASTGVLPALSLPGRYDIVYLPLLAIPLLLILVHVPWARWVFWPLAAVGAVLTLFGLTHAGGLVQFTPGKARADIGAANVLLRPWPTVSREGPAHDTTYAIRVCDRPHPGATVTGCGRAPALDVPAGTRGVVWTGSHRDIPAGEYTVGVALQRLGDADPGRQAATIEWLGNGDVVLREAVSAGQLTTGEYRAFLRTVRLRAAGTLGVRVRGTGAVGLRTTDVAIRSTISPLTGLGAVGPRFPDAGWVAAWIVVILALAAALAVSIPPRPALWRRVAVRSAS